MDELTSHRIKCHALQPSKWCDSGALAPEMQESNGDANQPRGHQQLQQAGANSSIWNDAVRAISGHFPLVRTLTESRRGVAMFRNPGARLRSAFTFAHSVNSVLQRSF